jgi:hypothetical protein
MTKGGLLAAWVVISPLEVSSLLLRRRERESAKETK